MFEPVLSFVCQIGQRSVLAVKEVGYHFALLVEAFYWLICGRWRRQPVRLAAIFKEAVGVGIDAIPIVALASFAIGMMLAIQGIYTLRTFGAEGQVVLGVAEVLGQFGRLDALVCNAAVADPRNITLESLDLAYWNRVLAVNLSGPMLLAKHCAPYLRAHSGAIVNIASARAHQSEPNSEAYAASKGGLLSASALLRRRAGYR